MNMNTEGHSLQPYLMKQRRSKDRESFTYFTPSCFYRLRLSIIAAAAGVTAVFEALNNTQTQKKLVIQRGGEKVSF